MKKYPGLLALVTLEVGVFSFSNSCDLHNPPTTTTTSTTTTNSIQDTTGSIGIIVK